MPQNRELLALLLLTVAGCGVELKPAPPASGPQPSAGATAVLESGRASSSPAPATAENSPAPATAEATGLAASSPDAPEAPAATGDLAKMQGTWKVVKFQIGTGNYPPQTAKAVFSGNQLAFPPIWDEMTVKLDSQASPKTIDFSPTSGIDKGLVWPGIYEFDGEQLKLCYIQNVEAERPTGFPTQRGNPWRVFVLERDSP